MAKFIKLTFLFLTISILLQNVYCKREKRGITDFIIPGINVGDIAIDSLKNAIFGVPVDKDQQILDKQFEHMETTREVLSLTQQIAQTTANIPEITILLQILNKLPSYFNKIDAAFRQYEVYRKRNISSYRVREFAKVSLDFYSGPIKYIHDLYSIVIPSAQEHKTTDSDDYSLLVLIDKYMESFEEMCDKYRSQQLIYLSVLDTMAIAEFKVYLIMEFAILKLSEREEMNYDEEVETLRSDLQERFNNLLDGFKKFMTKASRLIYRCDPAKQIEGETFFRMTIFQKYVVRESEIIKENTCYYTCWNFDNINQLKCMGYPDQPKGYPSACQEVRQCSGKLYGCQDKFSSSLVEDIRTCPAPKDSYRRYEFIEEKKAWNRFGPSYQEMPVCNQTYTWDRRNWNGWRQCEICLCICDDSPSPNADKRISLRVATADKDHIVTGIRWLKQDHTLHIQIEQGKVLARGKVDPATVRWKDIQKPRNENEVAYINYHQVRRFVLRDVEAPEGNVIAGVKLDTVNKRGSRLVTFRLLSLPYDYKTGALNYSTPFYEDPDNSLNQGVWDEPLKLDQQTGISEYGLGSAQVPMTIKGAAKAVNASEESVLLTTSDFKTDAGQNTVPFFDMQRNVLSPAAPLSAIGIYMKRKNNNDAGMLSIRLTSFDFTSHVTQAIHKGT